MQTRPTAAPCPAGPSPLGQRALLTRGLLSGRRHCRATTSPALHRGLGTQTPPRGTGPSRGQEPRGLLSPGKTPALPLPLPPAVPTCRPSCRPSPPVRPQPCYARPPPASSLQAPDPVDSTPPLPPPVLGPDGWMPRGSPASLLISSPVLESEGKAQLRFRAPSPPSPQSLGVVSSGRLAARASGQPDHPRRAFTTQRPGPRDRAGPKGGGETRRGRAGLCEVTGPGQGGRPERPRRPRPSSAPCLPGLQHRRGGRLPGRPGPVSLRELKARPLAQPPHLEGQAPPVPAAQACLGRRLEGRGGPSLLQEERPRPRRHRLFGASG